MGGGCRNADSGPAATQVLSALKLMLDHDGSGRGPRKIAQLKLNSNYMRDGLKAMGCNVLGDHDSPVMVRPEP